MAENGPAIAKIEKRIEEKSFDEDVLYVVLQIRPFWKRETIKNKVFTGGCTNKLIGCWNDGNENDMVLLRIYGSKTELFIDRDMEQKCMKVLWPLGCAPELYATFRNGLCYRFLDGVDLDVRTVRRNDIARLIAEKMVKMHYVQLEDEPRVPCIFKTLRNFFSLIPENYIDIDNNQRSQAYLPSKDILAQEIESLESHLPTLNSPIVFCHNDLLVKNIIYNSNAETVTFIDFEYAGYNPQAFDIANHFCEFAGMDIVDYSLYPDKEFQLNWLRTYLTLWVKNQGNGDTPITDEEVEKLYIQVQKFALAAHLLWGLWSLVQAVHSTINFDYLGYAGIRLKEYFTRKKEFWDLQMPASCNTIPNSTRL